MKSRNVNHARVYLSHGMFESHSGELNLSVAENDLAMRTAHENRNQIYEANIIKSASALFCAESEAENRHEKDDGRVNGKASITYSNSQFLFTFFSRHTERKSLNSSA
jgi:hypothetical protein